MKAKSVLLSMVMALSGSICLAEPVHIYASPDGLSPHEALREAREMRRLHKVGASDTLYIHLAEGTYYLGETLFVRPEDSGTPSSPTVIVGAEGGKSVLSGGMPIEMQKDSNCCKSSPVCLSSSPKGRNTITVRQLWQGDHNEVWIPLSSFQPFLLSDVDQEISNLEMILHQRWAIAILRVKSYVVEGDIVKLKFEEPESRLEFEHPWPQPVVNEDRGDGVLRTSSFNLLGGKGFIKPGSWYQDNSTGILHYYPKEDDCLNEDKCSKKEYSAEGEQDCAIHTFTAPVLQTIVEVNGSLERPVHDIIFRNVSFQHAAWNRPSFKGHQLRRL